MTYLLKSKRGNSRGSKIVLVVVFCVVCMLFIFGAGRYIPLSRMFVAVGTPLWSISNTISESIDSALSLFKTKQRLIENQRALEARLDALTQDASLITLLQDENASLKEVLGRTSFKRSILSIVLNNPTRTPYDTWIIDAGRELGVVSGAKVSVRGMVVGEVIEVTPVWARVRLFSSPGEEHQVIIGKTRVTALATGRGGGNFDARLPRELDVLSGDTVTFPELDKQIVGVVEAIEVTPSDSFQKILFKSPINIAETRFVEVELLTLK